MAAVLTTPKKEEPVSLLSNDPDLKLKIFKDHAQSLEPLRVFHEKFGFGDVIRIIDIGTSPTLEILFKESEEPLLKQIVGRAAVLSVQHTNEHLEEVLESAASLILNTSVRSELIPGLYAGDYIVVPTRGNLSIITEVLGLSSDKTSLDCVPLGRMGLTEISLKGQEAENLGNESQFGDRIKNRGVSVTEFCMSYNSIAFSCGNGEVPFEGEKILSSHLKTRGVKISLSPLVANKKSTEVYAQGSTLSNNIELRHAMDSEVIKQLRKDSKSAAFASDTSCGAKYKAPTPSVNPRLGTPKNFTNNNGLLSDLAAPPTADLGLTEIDLIDLSGLEDFVLEPLKVENPRTVCTKKSNDKPVNTGSNANGVVALEQKPAEPPKEVPTPALPAKAADVARKASAVTEDKSKITIEKSATEQLSSIHNGSKHVETRSNSIPTKRVPKPSEVEVPKVDSPRLTKDNVVRGFAKFDWALGDQQASFLADSINSKQFSDRAVVLNSIIRAFRSGAIYQSRLSFESFVQKHLSELPGSYYLTPIKT